jgi:hypothetical protein
VVHDSINNIEIDAGSKVVEAAAFKVVTFISTAWKFPKGGNDIIAEAFVCFPTIVSVTYSNTRHKRDYS